MDRCGGCRLYRAVAAVVGVAAGGGVRPGRDHGSGRAGAGAGEEPAVGGGQARRLRASGWAWSRCRRCCCTRRWPSGSPGARRGCRRWRGGRCAPTCGSSAAGSCRSCIRRICRCPGSGPSSPTARRRSTGTWRWPTPSPRRERRMRAAGLVCLGAGAGLIRGDLREVRGTDVACRSGGVVVTVRGARPRAVPVLARYHARLLAAARFAGTGLVCGGADPGRRNITNPLISALDGGGGLPRLDTCRLRATWLAEVRGAAGAGHVHARGRDQLLPAARRPGRRAGAGRRGRRGAAARGAPAMIRAGGVRGDHRRLRRRAADRGHAARRRAAPAAEGPHPAGRHVPGPGRSPARPPHPRAPGADQPARRRPAAAGRDRGLEARPAPAHLPADRAHLRPGRRRPRQGRARRAALRPAAGASATTCSRPPSRTSSRTPARRWPWTGRTWNPSPGPRPRGTSDCADPEASWGHRKNNLLRSEDELFYGYYLSAGIMMPDENGPAVPELARRATLSSCRHDPVRAFAPVLTAMPGQRDPARRHPRRLRLRPPRRRRLGHPAAGRRRPARPGPAPARPRPQGHPRTAPSSPTATCTARHDPAPLLELGPLARTATSEQAADHDRKTAELARYKLGRLTADDADGYHRVAVPRRHGQDPLPAPPRLHDAGPGPARDPAAPGAPPGLLRPADHHRPAGRARQDRAETRLPVRGLAPLLRPPHRRRTRLRHRQGPRHQRHQPAAGAASWAWHP